MLLCIVCVIVCLANRAKEKKDNELLKENPDAWATKKLVEQEGKRNQFETGAHIGMEVAKRFLK